MSINERKLKSQKTHDTIAQTIGDAEAAGINYIELRQTKVNPVGIQYVGIEEFKMKQVFDRNMGGTLRITPNLIKDGSLNFHADIRDVCYGYIADTEKNRQFLAYSLASGRFTITDSKIKHEIESLAVKIGVPTSPTRRKAFDEVVSNKEAIKVKDLEFELAEAKRQIEILKSDSEKKPLADSAKAKPAVKDKSKE